MLKSHLAFAFALLLLIEASGTQIIAGYLSRPSELEQILETSPSLLSVSTLPSIRLSNRADDGQEPLLSERLDSNWWKGMEDLPGGSGEKKYAFSEIQRVGIYLIGNVDVPTNSPPSSPDPEITSRPYRLISTDSELPMHRVNGLSYETHSGDLWVTTEEGIFVARARENYTEFSNVHNFKELSSLEQFSRSQNRSWDIFGETLAFTAGDKIEIRSGETLEVSAQFSSKVFHLDFDNGSGDLWATTDSGLFVARAAENYQQFTPSPHFDGFPRTEDQFWDVDHQILAYNEGQQVIVSGDGIQSIRAEVPLAITGLDFDSPTGDLWAMTEQGLFVARASDGYQQFSDSHELSWFPGTSDPNWDIDGKLTPSEGYGWRNTQSSERLSTNQLGRTTNGFSSGLGASFSSAGFSGGGGGAGGGGGGGGGGSNPPGSNPPGSDPPGGDPPGDDPPGGNPGDDPSMIPVVPEPTSIALWGMGALGISRILRQRKGSRS